jgi:hypothetical protein
MGRRERIFFVSLDTVGLGIRQPDRVPRVLRIFASRDRFWALQLMAQWLLLWSKSNSN